jgi:hypothetical protein
VHLSLVTIVVSEYDPAIDFFVGPLSRATDGDLIG